MSACIPGIKHIPRLLWFVMPINIIQISLQTIHLFRLTIWFAFDVRNGEEKRIHKIKNCEELLD